ncbi:MAG: pyrroline-5-carboxylate reductase [Candidatus Binatia bacterium]|nr:MAG: pyrroline-5-carboxylate reductase [Candidatus Binatia bacterium]
MSETRHRMPRVGIVGAGNMATALVRGFLRARLYRPKEILVSDTDPVKRRLASRRLGVRTTAENVEVVEKTRTVVLAVKPQVLDSVLEEIRPAVTGRHLVVSIAAGVSTARIEGRLGEAARVVRVMPNTPALLGRGMSVLVRGRRATVGDQRLALKLFRAVGSALAVEREDLLDPVTGLAGSGPAYVYRFAEALIAGGEKAGLPLPLAQKLALETLLGAAHMLVESGESPQRLREMVTSPGGTTLAGLEELERRGFFEAVVAAIEAATRRSRELGGS